MASNVFGGRSGLLTVAASSTSSYVTCGGVRDWQFALDTPSIDVVHQDTSGWTERLPGNTRAWGLTIGAVVLSTSATISAQNTMRAAFAADTRAGWRITPDKSRPNSPSFTGVGYVQGFQLAGDVPGNSPQLHNFTAGGDGNYVEG